ncbi:MAG: hypothetical protein K2L89_06840, partial [Muribaculaceae bacterium]|nr:hypothetical protein [Muribaculaceae bacterium]
DSDFESSEAHSPTRPLAHSPKVEETSTRPLAYKEITTSTHLRSFSDALLPEKQCGIYFSAEGENDMSAVLKGVAIASPTGETTYIPASFDEGMAFVLDLLARPDIMKISANVKRDIVFAARLRKKIEEREERGASLVCSCDNTLRVLQNYYDISLAHYILQPEMRHGITELASQYLNYQLPVSVTSTKRGGAKEEDPETAAELAWLTLQLCAPLKALLENESEEMRKLLYDVEFPLIEVLAEMELTGVRIDVEALNEAAKAMESRIAALEKEIFELAGEEFNVGSPAKVGEILFDKLQLDPKAKKTKTGQYSTSEDILEKLIPKNPIVEKILKFRQLRKLLNTYLTAFRPISIRRRGRCIPTITRR